MADPGTSRAPLHEEMYGDFWVRNTLAKTTLSCNLYGAAAADPGRPGPLPAHPGVRKRRHPVHGM